MKDQNHGKRIDMQLEKQRAMVQVMMKWQQNGKTLSNLILPKKKS